MKKLSLVILFALIATLAFSANPASAAGTLDVTRNGCTVTATFTGNTPGAIEFLLYFLAQPASGEAVSAVYTFPGNPVGGSQAHTFPAGDYTYLQISLMSDTGSLYEEALHNEGEWSCEAASNEEEGVVVQETPKDPPILRPVGCDALGGEPGAVVGQVGVETIALWGPKADAVTHNPVITLKPGQTLWVYGVDSTGMFQKVSLGCTYLWVPVGTMGPNPDAVWNNAGMPGRIVK